MDVCSKISIFSTLLSIGLLFLGGINAQSPCGIVGHPNNSATLPPVPGHYGGGVLIGNFQLYNVSTTTTVSHPYNQFVQALRYQDGAYELRTSATWAEFVTLHEDSEILRMANLYCDDNVTSVRFTFTIPVMREEEDTTVHTTIPTNGTTMTTTELPMTSTPSTNTTMGPTNGTTTTDVPSNTTTTVNVTLTTTELPLSSTTPLTNTTTTEDPVTGSTTGTPRPCGHVSCPPGEDVNIADPADCSGFVQCADGTPYCFRCPSGLLYDPSLDQCSFPADVDCGDRPLP